ncbi:hypothetical protein Glove_270g4 [Diversispora epigaea]|uniref:Uncharacterized protein n=1 Tax=Diversispora epigaea TaxID=1348612 RepID=A0A397ICN8_9GLOM|nr:hypothetical protein Glove_270g4 [Diversispora epigaea]
MFRYENSKIEDEKSYGEQNSGNWWKRAERSISNHANILSIILYSDATTTDTLGKSSLHPIYVSLGNIPTWRRNKEDAKQLLGYLPILSAKNEKEKKSSEFKELARETFHNSIKFLLDPLFQGDVQREDLIDIRKEVILRNHVNMKEYFDSNTSKLAGLEQVNNYFWSIPNLNIYAATVPDRMHHLDLGLFKYQIEFTMELLKKKKSLNKVNERIADIPRHSQLKVFKKGIQLSRLTASEYRDMMKIMVFMVDDLQIEDLSEVYMKWNEMYLLSRSEKFKESDLENFQKAINDWGDLFIKLFQNISNSHLKFPKLHSWIYHIVDTIRKYGAINGYTTETYESLHKTYVKIPYRLSNKKEVEKQIMENIRRRAIISRNRIGKTKTPMAFMYTTKLFDFDLSESMIEQNKKDLNLDKKMIKGFEKFIDCLKVYLNILNIISAEGCRIKIYSSVTLKNGAILRTKNDFHHRPWFSNIAVNMNEEELSEYLSDKGICYAQTLLITEIRLPNKSPMHLALVQWYDFIEETPFVYGCPLLRLVEVYNFIEIEVIEDTIHVVPRFDKNNEYFATTPPTSRQKKIFETHIKKLLPYRSYKVYPLTLAEMARSSAHISHLLPYHSYKVAGNTPLKNRTDTQQLILLQTPNSHPSTFKKQLPPPSNKLNITSHILTTCQPLSITSQTAPGELLRLFRSFKNKLSNPEKRGWSLRPAPVRPKAFALQDYFPRKTESFAVYVFCEETGTNSTDQTS